MLNEINGAEGLASPQTPPLRLNASLLLMAGVLEGMKDESGYKSFFEKAEAGCFRPS
jgi:hypothetical protein